MKNTKLIISSLLVVSALVSTQVSAEGYGYPVSMPMNPNMQGQSPYSQGPNPMMMQQMMRMRQQAMQQPSSANAPENPMPGDMGMMGAKGGMPMMGMRNGGNTGMPMMGNGGNSGMPMMKMMKEKRAEMKSHMQTVETRLGNIEGLLQQLVELQKTR